MGRLDALGCRCVAARVKIRSFHRFEDECEDGTWNCQILFPGTNPGSLWIIKDGFRGKGGGGEDFWNTSHVAGLFDGCLHPPDP